MRAVAAAFVATALLVTVEARAEPDHPPVVDGDRVLLERVMVETGVARSTPAPSWNAYLGDVAQALLGALGRRSRPLADWVGSHGSVLLWAAWLLLASLAVAIVAFFGRMLARSRRPRAEARRSAVEAREAPAPERDRESWKAELEARLLADDAAGALVALWWWMARSLVRHEVDRSWTSRELLERCGRGDLKRLAHTLDRLMYGRTRPAAADVRRLLGQLEAVLP